jgi:hypothetical protein
MSCIDHSQGTQLQAHVLPFFIQINIEDQTQVLCPLHFRENTILVYFHLLHEGEISMEYVQQAFFY